MLKQPSLKRHILALALTSITLVWVAAAALTYIDARRELNEVLDAHLAQASTLLVAQTSHELEEVETEHDPLQHKYSLRVAFQIWEEGNRLRLRSANAPTEPLSLQENGYSDATINGQRWRVFSAWDNDHSMLIHVAEKTEVRDQLARGIALNLLEPLWIALPLLGIMLWLTVTGSLRPLKRMTNEIEHREPDNLTALDAGTAPSEVLPLIGHLNNLFMRINALIQNERRFTADAAHELRTPVAAIKAQAQVARGATDPQERLRALDQAIAGCDRTSHLIDQLLTLARLDIADADHREPCALRALVAEVMAEIAPTALNKGVQLELIEGAEITTDGLPTLLRIMLRNLLDNAVRHTPAGTLVRVEMTGATPPCITVTDNGPGLPAEELEKISRRFYRPLETKASGSGLGLSIVQRIVEIHRASMEIGLAPNHSGLRVTITFSSHDRTP